MFQKFENMVHRISVCKIYPMHQNLMKGTLSNTYAYLMPACLHAYLPILFRFFKGFSFDDFSDYPWLLRKCSFSFNFFKISLVSSNSNFLSDFVWIIKILFLLQSTITMRLLLFILLNTTLLSTNYVHARPSVSHTTLASQFKFAEKADIFVTHTNINEGMFCGENDDFFGRVE